MEHDRVTGPMTYPGKELGEQEDTAQDRGLEPFPWQQIQGPVGTPVLVGQVGG